MKTSVKPFIFSPVKSDTKTLLKAYKIPLVLMTLLMGVLIFVMNVFLSASLYGNQVNTQLKDKLGVYIYLDDTVTQEDSQLAIGLKTALENAGLRVNYASKQDALSFVEKRIPELTTTFQKYNLENPLPSTLYIRYNSASDFEAMKKILERNKDLILNIDDVSDNALEIQENRVLNVINLSNFLQKFGYSIVGGLLLTIIAFAIFFLRTVFSHFISDIQAKKLLGASATQIIQPFLNVIFIALGIGFLISGVLFVGSFIPLNHYLGQVMHVNLLSYLMQYGVDVALLLILEVSVLALLLGSIAYRFVRTLHRKLK